MTAPVRVALAALAIAVLIVMFGVAGALDDVPDSPRVTEDDPGWDCETMGNRVCGDAP